VSGDKSADGCLLLKLRPYDLRAFRQADAQGRVKGGSATVSAEQVAELAKVVETAAALFREKSSKGADLSAVKPYLELAQKCLADKEYARLHFLVQESWHHALTK
jgi:hypothetical protein